VAAGLRLYAISYDDVAALAAFAEAQRIPYPLLSDADSEVIRRFGILNTQIEPGDAMLYGIPYPGVYVTDEDGAVVAKFFNDSYKKRESPELLIDAALGRIELAGDTPRAQGGDDRVRVTAVVHGGRGTLRQGIRRQLVVRFELADGLHLYGEPVPAGMLPTTVTVTGPPGLVLEPPVFPPTRPLRLESLGLELPVWSGRVDVVVPFHAAGPLASEVRPLDQDSATLEVSVRYQACDDQVCLLPRTERLSLEVPLDVVDVPSLAMHRGHGQREGGYDATPHLRRLFLRKVRRHPLGFLRFLWKSLRLEWAARRRRA
jgi:AhpC/TSA family/Thiol:disulfide interchange protein DsbD, N-terminal